MGEYTYLSHFINEETPLYGGKKDLQLSPASSISNGDSANSMNLVLGNHSGTHIDYPYHFSDDGKKLNDYPASFWLFRNAFCLGYKAQPEELISLNQELDIVPENVEFLVIKTGFQEHRGSELYWNNNPGLHPQFASVLRNKFPQLKIIGFDLISLTSYQHRPEGRIAHKEFLMENDILVIEDMKLDEISDGELSEIICLPLMIDEADGVPVTIICK